MSTSRQVARSTAGPESGFGELERLLIHACRRGALETGRPLEIGPLLDGRRRRQFVELAGRHRVLGLVLSRLVPRLDSSTGGCDFLEEWAGFLRDLRRRAALSELKKDAVLRHLRRAGIAVMALKGAALRATVFQEPVEREVEDLDLLVVEEDLERVLETLTRDGVHRFVHSPEEIDVYRQHHFHILLHDRDGFPTEIHWDLTRPGQSFRLDPTEMWAESVEVDPVNAPGQRLPAPHHLVLHIVLQHLQEGFSRFDRVVDIDRIVCLDPRFDWKPLVRAAVRGRMESALAVSLQLSRRTLDTDVPEEVLGELSPSPAARFHLAIMRPEESLLRQRMRQSYSLSRLFELWLVRRFGRRVVEALRQIREASFVALTEGKRVRAREVLYRFVKLWGAQFALYLSAVRSLTLRDSAPSWFWSCRKTADDPRDPA